MTSSGASHTSTVCKELQSFVLNSVPWASCFEMSLFHLQTGVLQYLIIGQDMHFIVMIHLNII